MQAVPPMDIYATMWLFLSEETRLKTHTAFLHSDIKDKTLAGFACSCENYLY